MTNWLIALITISALCLGGALLHDHLKGKHKHTETQEEEDDATH